MLLRIGVYKRTRAPMEESGKVVWTRIIHSQEIPLPVGKGRAITIGAGEKHEVKVNKTYFDPAQTPVTLRTNTSGELSITTRSNTL